MAAKLSAAAYITSALFYKVAGRSKWWFYEPEPGSAKEASRDSAGAVEHYAAYSTNNR